MKKRKINLYNVTIKFISGNIILYPNVEAYNKDLARLRVRLDRQKRGDEMFIKSMDVEMCMNYNED